MWKVARAGAGDFENAVGGVCFCGKGEWDFFVLAGECGNGDGLAVIFAGAPDERDLDLAAGRASEINAAGIFLAVDQSQAFLLDAVRRGGIESDARALVADERVLLVHDDDFFRTDGIPFAQASAESAATLWSGRFGFLCGNREVEFAVIDHFGPEAAVHGGADVLDELTVEVLGDRRCCLLRVDGDLQLVRNSWRRLLCGGCDSAPEPQCRCGEHQNSCFHLALFL